MNKNPLKIQPRRFHSLPTDVLNKNEKIQPAYRIHKLCTFFKYHHSTVKRMLSQPYEYVEIRDFHEEQKQEWFSVVFSGGFYSGSRLLQYHIQKTHRNMHQRGFMSGFPYLLTCRKYYILKWFLNNFWNCCTRHSSSWPRGL